MHPAETHPAASRPDNLALLYQNVLTGVVRIQAGRQPLNDIEVFRKRMKAALQDVEREAGLAGYRSNDVRDAEFAVVAFLDETILSLRDPKAEDWRKKPLNIELFGQAIAGGEPVGVGSLNPAQVSIPRDFIHCSVRGSH